MAAIEAYRGRYSAITSREEADMLLRDLLNDRDMMQRVASDLVSDLTESDNIEQIHTGNGNMQSQHPDGIVHIQHFQLRN